MKKLRFSKSRLGLSLLAAGLFGSKPAFAHVEAHRAPHDFVGVVEKNPGSEAVGEKHGSVKLVVLDEVTKKEVPFMVGLTRRFDQRDFRPPNAVELSVIFEGKGQPGSRRESRLPRTLSGYTWCVPKGFATELPVGEWEILIRRGIEHYPTRLTIQIEEGQTVEKTIHIRRWANMAERGWISGDDHVHCRTADAADREMILTWAKAEDVFVVNALRMDDIKQSYFSPSGFGKEHRLVDGNFAIVPGQEGPRTYDLGHVLGLDIKEHSWKPETYHCYDGVIDELRAQGAVTGYAHAHAAVFNLHRDMSMNIPKGKIDFFEIFQSGWMGMKWYYAWLNLGYKMTAMAGSDVPWCGTMAEERVYVYTGSDKLDVDQWFKALKKGRTFVTNGPLIDFRINDALPGDTISIEKGQKLRVHARAWAEPKDFRPYRMEIIQNGEVIRSVEQTSPEQTELVLDFDLDAENGSWIAVHVAEKPGLKFKKRALAHTTPIYLEREGLRFWKYDEVEDLINARLADLHDVEEMIRLAHKSKAEGKNFLNTEFREWALDYRIDRIIATEDLLRERVRTAEERYTQLRDIYENEKVLRAME